MSKIRDLNKVAEIIEKTAKEQFEQLRDKEKIEEVKKNLEKFSSMKTQDFTFTVGEMNAYLG